MHWSRPRRRWAKLRSDIDAGSVPEEFDLTKELVEAVKRTADMRGRGQKLEEYLAQHDAFDHIEPNVDGFIRNFYDPNTKRAKSAQRIAKFLRFYATEARDVAAEAEPGIEAPNVISLLDYAAKKAQPRAARSHSQRPTGKKRRSLVDKL